ncbi:MAG: multicopper oxidase domain-containing protein [Flavobacteriales bacterium]|nr:multicopper oxidase domain-containing protein [Flavobacteriales bacterium]
MSYLGPTLRWQKDSTVNMNITNTFATDSTTVHWHGIYYR